MGVPPLSGEVQNGGALVLWLSPTKPGDVADFSKRRGNGKKTKVEDMEEDRTFVSRGLYEHALPCMVRDTMKRKATLSCASLLVFAFVSGCASPQFSRIDSNRALYETWPIEIRQAVLDGKAEPGMTPDMVRMALGKPSEIVGGSNSAEEIWVYRTGGDVDQSTMGYPGSYPSSYPGGYPGTYPGTMGGTGIGVQPSIGISTGPGGTIVGGGINPSIGMGTAIGPATIGIGSGMGGIGTGIGGPGVMGPMPMPATPVVDREVVFRDGVVYRADNPTK
ncbi:MAG: hypothetical protein ABIZ81_17485 [Opitutaceae bacterium]